METVLSGIRSTGNLHLGNYYGALRNFIRMQHEYNCFFFIADYHSLTTHPHPLDLHANVKSVLVEYLAAGLDPELCTLYVQSDVPEIPELSLLLSMNVYMGELAKTVSFKEKARKQPENINAGLLTYPILMAADILIHKANKVPVGKDQEQHLEMTRHFARRFNNMFEVELFPEPEPFNFGQNLIKIPGLDGTGKMGKSEGNGVFLADEPDVIRKKVMRAVSDAGPTEPNQPMAEPIANLFTILEVVSTPDVVTHFRDAYNNCNIRYGDLKKQLAEDIILSTEPIRQRMKDIAADSDYLRKVAKMGAEKARASASKTLEEVRRTIGFKPFNMSAVPDFITEYSCAVTVCDIDGIIVYMNEKSVANFSKWGGKELIGKSLFDCHNPTSNEKIRELLQTGEDNIYFSKTSGKIIHQTAWRENGIICGLVELSFERPKE